MLKNHRLALAVGGAMMLAGWGGVSQADAAIILQDTFTDNPGLLHGRAVETPQNAGDKWTVSGTPSGVVVGAGVLDESHVSGGRQYGKTSAPFSSAGITQKYTLSEEFTFDATNKNQFYTGFGNSSGDGSTFVDNVGSAMFYTNYAAGATSTTVYAVLNNMQAGSRQYSTTLTASGGTFAATLAITVDPNAATDNIEFFVNHVSLGTSTYTGNIGGLWTKFDYTNVGPVFTLDNVSVTTVPEPASLALLGVSGLVMLRRRRG